MMYYIYFMLARRVVIHRLNQLYEMSELQICQQIDRNMPSVAQP